ncbi:MAG: hypothetical protein IT319_01005 [Anaerolineae bacterium]|nr:hypothetical protein [Anaerolineae bacterium]
MLSDNDLELLSAYMDGTLSDAERAALDARLRGDAELRRELARLQATVDLVKLLPPLTAPRDFRLTPGMVRRRTTVWTSAAFSFASAAAAVLLLVVGVALFQTQGTSLPPAALSNQVAALSTAAPTLTTKLGDDETDSAARDVLPAEEGEAPTQVAQEPMQSREMNYAAPTGTPPATGEPQMFAAVMPTGTPSTDGLLSDMFSETTADQAQTEVQQVAPSAASGAAAEAPAEMPESAAPPLPAPTQSAPTVTPFPTTTPSPEPSHTPTPLPTATLLPTLTPTPVPPVSVLSEPGALGSGLIVLALLLFVVATATMLARRRGS